VSGARLTSEPPGADLPRMQTPSAAPPRRTGLVTRLVSSPLFWAATLGVLFGLPMVRSMSRRLSASPAMLGTLPAFTLTDQTGHPYGTRQLSGRVWVADFIFTSCQQACPLLTQRMAEIGHRTRHLGPDFHLVSISVDPERDTPERMAEYSMQYGANPVQWSMLTGPADAVQAAVTDGFKVGMGRERVAGDGGAGGEFWQIFHGENLVLVDRALHIRGYFPATPEGLDQLMDAIGRVVNETRRS
jgi:protein SCO1/2